MKEKVQSAMDNYVLAYRNNDKSLFRSLWDDEAVFEDPVGADPCNGIEAICAFWDFAKVPKCTYSFYSIAWIGSHRILKYCFVIP